MNDYKILGLNLKDINTLGKRVAQLRKEKGWTQEYLAELIGFNRNQIAYLENDRLKYPNRELVLRLVKIFETTHEWLEQGKGKKYAVQENTEMKTEGGQNIMKTIDRAEAVGMDVSLAQVLRVEVEELLRRNQQHEKTVADLLKVIKKLKEK